MRLHGEAATDVPRPPLDYLLAFAGWYLVLGSVAFPLSAAFLPPTCMYSTLPVFAAVAIPAAPLSWWYLRTGRRSVTSGPSTSPSSPSRTGWSTATGGRGFGDGPRDDGD